MKALLVTLGSGVLTAAVLTNAFYQKKQFYPSVVYLTKSNPSMAILYVQAFVFVLLAGKLVRKVFFGQLRAAEMEHLIERSWYAVTETCLAFTVFRDDLSPKFVALFTLLLFLKCFHWLAEDRVDFMERSPNISVLFHIRVISLLALLWGLDALNVHLAYQSTLAKGASVQLVFGFEYAILFTVVMNIAVKYVLHFIDLHRENPWDDKAVYLLYGELLMGFAKVILYLSFISIMMKIHTFPLFAIRPMYLSMRAFKKALNDVVQSRRAIRNMNTLYPDATVADLESSDNVCIICREEMIGGNGSAKKLPCGHIFHISCLRSWFQRQQTCPTCRMDVLRAPGATPAAAGQAPPNAQPGVNPVNFLQWQQAMIAQLMAQQQRNNNNNVLNPNANNQQPAAPRANGLPQQAAPAAPQAAPTVPQAVPGQPPVSPIMPMMMTFMMNSAPQMPRPPTNLGQLSVEQLREMEGQERANIEARLRCLQDIRTLLDAASLQFRQYQNVAPTAPQASSSSSGSATSSSEATSQNNATLNGSVSSSSVAESTPSPSVSNDTPQNVENIPLSEEEKKKEEIRLRRLERFASSDASNGHSEQPDDATEPEAGPSSSGHDKRD
ncbi:E3 ubiquitin-protein ligase synoviolin [Halotydeus destructor]|nr:E3 ubiquitin-protein ligase synoviolin [Halotydeus destructor]